MPTLDRSPAPSTTRQLLDSFWRAAAYCLHPKVIALSLAPLLVVGAVTALVAHFWWTPAVASVRASLEGWPWLDGFFSWLRSVGGSTWVDAIAPLVLVAAAVPVVVIASLLVAALLMTPAIVRLVAARRFARLETKRGGGIGAGLAWSLACTGAALLALVASIPLWFVPPLVLVVPPLIWGWLTYRVLAYDVLATHASRDERIRLMRAERWALLGAGVVCGYLGAAPTLLWAASAFAVVFAPVLIVFSVWLYTLVFAFSSLWFAHFLLAALERLRVDDAALAAVAAPPVPSALPLPGSAPISRGVVPPAGSTPGAPPTLAS